MSAEHSDTAVEAAARRGYAEATKESADYPVSPTWDDLPPDWQNHWRRIAVAVLGSASEASHLVIAALDRIIHEIDNLLVETPMPDQSRRKLRAFLKETIP